MERWTIYESFDPTTGRLYLDVFDSSAAVSPHEGLQTKPLESFHDFREAHAFLDGYVMAIKQSPEKPIREVFCGKHQHPGCEIGPCVLGVTNEYRCAHRDKSR